MLFLKGKDKVAEGGGMRVGAAQVEGVGDAADGELYHLAGLALRKLCMFDIAVRMPIVTAAEKIGEGIAQAGEWFQKKGSVGGAVVEGLHGGDFFTKIRPGTDAPGLTMLYPKIYR